MLTALSNKRGFTLIEIVITIVLLSIISGLAAMIIMQGLAAYLAEQNRGNAHYQAGSALDRMSREIHSIRSRADITTMLPDSLRFTHVNGGIVGFSWINPVVNRWNGATNDPLASGITAFNLMYYDQGGVQVFVPANVYFVEITMTAQQGAELQQMRTRVHPRNF